jgi:hypothetical protein
MAKRRSPLRINKNTRGDSVSNLHLRERAPRTSQKPNRRRGNIRTLVSKVLMSRREFPSSNTYCDGERGAKIFLRYLCRKALRHGHFRVLIEACAVSTYAHAKIYVRIMNVALSGKARRAHATL